MSANVLTRGGMQLLADMYEQLVAMRGSMQELAMRHDSMLSDIAEAKTSLVSANDAMAMLGARFDGLADKVESYSQLCPYREAISAATHATEVVSEHTKSIASLEAAASRNGKIATAVATAIATLLALLVDRVKGP